MENFDVSKLTDNTEVQLLDKVDVLKEQNGELLNQIDKLEGIRGALEEKVSAYRYRLKEVTRQLEDIDATAPYEEAVYHNKDNLERRRFILRRNLVQQDTKECSAAVEDAEKNDELPEKYERLLEQYMYEREKNEQLFNYLFQKDENAALELFVKADAADTLLEATALSRRIIQQAEERARHIGTDLKEQLRGVF
ncbi:hypothetical protein P7E02_06235 [Enterococcus hulanensis]|uniref:hypothetical protein n=1 Tax=Enterococcus hulanensis TaxID=2559929 RepID=UPI00288E1B6E|nr:hypothetical protein [Enterococcus hulanensis]MDT2659457.1 hypothetical protein [Enterococcus hulanensis]